MDNKTEAAHKKASFLQALRIIGWGYLGVRSQRGYQEDMNSITLGQTVVIGIIVWLVFIACVASLALYVSR